MSINIQSKYIEYQAKFIIIIYNINNAVVMHTTHSIVPV